MLVTVMTAGIVPEYSVVRYHVKGDPGSPHVGYLLQQVSGNSILVEPFGTAFIPLGAEDFVELLATPAATACFYIGKNA